jgi:hypothetical protein
MLHLKARIAVAVTVAGASLSILAASAPANAASLPADLTQTWAGYFSATSKPITGAEVSFTVPKVSCAGSRGATGGASYRASMWVGIGGMIDGIFGNNSGVLKQDGVIVSCASKNAAPVYTPFWELVPGTPQRMTFKGNPTVQPGAQITAQVWAPSESPVPGQWYFDILSTYHGHTTRWTASHAASVTSKNYTAEVITERSELGLVDLASVTYTYADYFTSEDSFYSIAAKRIDMVNNLTQKDPVILTGNAYQAPDDDLKDSFTTSYAANWLR